MIITTIVKLKALLVLSDIAAEFQGHVVYQVSSFESVFFQKVKFFLGRCPGG